MLPARLLGESPAIRLPGEQVLIYPAANNRIVLVHAELSQQNN